MHFSAISMVSLAMMLLSASARSIEKVRSDAGGMTVEQASQQCGNDQTVSCCNTSTTDNASGLLGANALNGLLGGSCTVIPVSAALGLSVPISQACSGNQAACCTGDQSGLVNVQCTPIQI